MAYPNILNWPQLLGTMLSGLPIPDVQGESVMKEWLRAEQRKCPTCGRTNVKYGGWAAQAVGAETVAGWECVCGTKFQAACLHDSVSRDRVCNHCGAME